MNQEYYRPTNNDFPEGKMRPSNQQGFSLNRIFANNWKAICGVLAVAILLLVAHQAIMASISSDEIDMNTQFAACQRALGKYYQDSEAALGIAKENSKDLITIINAVATRQPAMVGGTGNVPGLNSINNQVYVQLANAYPNVGNVSYFYKQAEAIMIGYYDNYSATGQDMSIMIGRFNKDRKGFWGFLYGGFPDDTLTAQVGTEQPVYGKAAFALMSEVITNQAVTTSYDKGYTMPVLP